MYSIIETRNSENCENSKFSPTLHTSSWRKRAILASAKHRECRYGNSSRLLRRFKCDEDNTDMPQCCLFFFLTLVQSYLQNFYDLQIDRQPHLRSAGQNHLSAKLKEMQEFFGLQVSGKPDLDTIEMMRKPRCGVPEIGQYSLTPGNPKWKRNNLTYR